LQAAEPPKKKGGPKTALLLFAPGLEGLELFA
jgi:hypothetical protein